MSSTDFVHETLPQRVVFRMGAAREALAEELDRLGAERALLVCTESEAELATRLTEGLPIAATFTEVRPHVPVSVAEAARAAADEIDADVVVSIGGGSTTGTAKVVALTRDVPVIAVPTTYAGSEATPVWGLTDDAGKTTGTDPRVLPRVVIYDAELIATLPAELSVASGLNALAHSVDSLWAPRRNPLLSSLAAEAIRALAESLPHVLADGADLEARAGSLYGAYLSATTFAGAGSGLHHKICHVLGGRWDLPHAQTHAVVLPHVLAFNAPNAPEAAQAISAALGGGAAVEALVTLYQGLDAPRALRDLGLAEENLDEATDLILAAAPPDNPTEVTRDGIRALLQRAWSGAAPAPAPASQSSAGADRPAATDEQEDQS